MFINICITFLKVLFLPLLLLLAFAFPFYMVFVRKDSEELDAPRKLASFASPAHAIAKTMVQIVGEIDFELIFNEGDLLYNPMTYILFVVFLITVPVLFINLLIGLAVGDTNEEKEKAEFTKIEVQVDFILERERNSKFLREIKNNAAEFGETDEVFDSEGCCGKYRFTRFLAQVVGGEYKRHIKLVKKLEERNQAIYNDVLGLSDVEAVRATLKQESEKISQLKEDIKALTAKESEKISQLRDDIKALTVKVEALGKDNDSITN